MKSIVKFIIFLPCFFVVHVSAQTRTLEIAGHVINVEIADTPETRKQGLMHRKTLDADAGMLFIFDDKDHHCFWMKNTRFPLSIAFITDHKNSKPQGGKAYFGEISTIEVMQPGSEEFHCSSKPVRYALEMNLNWFKNNKIPVGSEVFIFPKAKDN